MQKRDFCENALNSNHSMNNDQSLRNLTVQQQNGQFSENVNNNVSPEVVERWCCDSPSEHYFKKSARQLTNYSLHNRSSKSCQEALPKVAHVNPKSSVESDTSLINPDHNNRPNTSCYDISSDFFNEYQQPSSELEKSLTNPDNSNRPNTNCNGVLQKGVHSETTAVVKSVEGSVMAAISQLRQLLNNNLTEMGQQVLKVGQQMLKVEQKVEKVVTDLTELSGMVDHGIGKDDQEPERVKQELRESEKITDKFKSETPALIQRADVSRITIEVEGKPIQFRVDADANPSLVVPERIAMQVLARKYGTLDKMGQYITLGQAVVTMEYGRVKCDTPMLIIKNDP
ncbi:MAG: hypothetical protein GY820_25225, partial [Gammaproteobacteria bacterium]|nr:hypothetical protein [Gammaproteobacteria bacterium]